MACLENAHRNGHWVRTLALCLYAWARPWPRADTPSLSFSQHQVILNNIHLMPRWLVQLEQRLDEFAQARFPYVMSMS